jgi:hypothetical protein
MAHLLNVSLGTKIPPKPPLSLTKPSLSIPRFLSLSHSRCPNPQVRYTTSHSSSSSSSVLAKFTFSLFIQQQALILNKQLLEDFAKTGLLALLSVSLFFTDPALAFKVKKLRNSLFLYLSNSV